MVPASCIFGFAIGFTLGLAFFRFRAKATRVPGKKERRIGTPLARAARVRRLRDPYWMG